MKTLQIYFLGTKVVGKTNDSKVDLGEIIRILMS
jgi:hypothetical protein